MTPPVLIAAITVAGAVLRFATLGQGVWFDEAGTVREVTGSLHHLWYGIAHQDLTPPLYVFCLWCWGHLLGSGVLALRAMSALLGTLVIPVAYVTADRLVGRRAAVTVALLAACSPVMLYYSQEMRAYALLVLLCSLGLLAFVAALRAPSRRRLALWTVCSAAAFATHYFAALVVAPQAAALLLAAWRRRELRLARALCIAVLGAEALALTALLRFQGAHADHYVLSVIHSPFVPEHFDRSVAAIGDAQNLGEDLLMGPGGPAKQLATLALLACVLLGVFNVWRNQRRRGRTGAELAILMLPAAMLAVAVFQLIGQPYQGRYLLVVWLPLTILVGTGVSLIGRRLPRAAAIAGICGGSLAIGVITAAVPRFSGREDVATPAGALGTASTTRLLAISQQWDLLPLRLYRPATEGVANPVLSVRELDVIAMPYRGFPADSDADRPAAPRLVGLPASMTLRRVIVGPTYVIERYEAPRPVVLRLAPSAGSFDADWRFLLERAGGRFVSPA